MLESKDPIDGNDRGEDSDSDGSPVLAVLVWPLPLCWSSSWSSGPACAGVQRSPWGSSRWHLCWVCGWRECRWCPAQVEAPRFHLQNNSVIGFSMWDPLFSTALCGSKMVQTFWSTSKQTVEPFVLGKFEVNNCLNSTIQPFRVVSK